MKIYVITLEDDEEVIICTRVWGEGEEDRWKKIYVM